MKIELETIPVWDGIRSNSECFLCDLMQQSEQDAISYYLGSSVMHPETRVKVNTTGFCPHHWHGLAKAGKAQSLALIGHTYLQQTRDQLNGVMSNVGKAKAGKKTDKAVEQVIDRIKRLEEGCLICTDMEKRLIRYTYTTIYLWRDDSDFRREFALGKGVCLHHMKSLLDTMPKVLDTAQRHEFSSELIQLVQDNLKRLEDDIWWMTQKYKAEHRDSPWNGCEDAQKRLVRKLTGDGRIVYDS